jgi:DNA-binding IclR family transcriptional regulator
MSDVLTLPDDLRALVTWMMRQGEVSLSDVAGHVAADEPATLAMLNTLTADGYVRVAQSAEGARYQVNLQSRPTRRPTRDIFKALDDL